MFINKLVETNESISRKHGDFRMVYKLVRKNYLNQIIIFLLLSVLVILNIRKLHDEEVISFFSVFLIVLHIRTITPSIFLLVNFVLLAENQFTSSI